MDLEHKQILSALEKIFRSLETLKEDLGQKFLSRENFEIYYKVINKDLDGIANMVRKLEKEVKELEVRNNQQDLKHNTLSTKVATILGIGGGLSGVGSIIWFILRRISE